jgi:hypothetical protein
MERSGVCGRLVFVILLFVRAASPVYAGPLTAGDLLVSDPTQYALYEYTPDGGLVQTISVPPTADRYNRGVAVDEAGNIQVFNGTFRPTLSTYDPAAQTWAHHSYPGWSTIGTLFFGGVATYRDFVYVTDAFTPNGGEPNGIVRFNRADYSAQRFATGIDFGYITLGRDGLLYGLGGRGSPAGNDLYVFDPSSMALVRRVTLSVETRGIAVDEVGHIFGPGALMDHNIYEFDQDGQIVKWLSTQVRFMNDIALSADGQLVIGVASGEDMLMTDTSLSDSRPFHVGDSGAFVTWVPAPVPEPASSALLTLSTLGLLVYGGRRKGNLSHFLRHLFFGRGYDRS